MKIYLAGENGINRIIREDQGKHEPYILKSFLECSKEVEELLPMFGDFMLDSGAFTFMQGRGGEVDWDDYIERYADFIKRNDIQKHFELDIDVVVGYEKVKQIRAKLERLTGKQPIPVWHISRGIEEFYKDCSSYPYVALRGIVSGEWSKKAEACIPKLIKEAHSRGAKIHGLGFTKLTKLKQYHFDSVDSTAWLAGSRFGYVYYFDGQTMQKKEAPKGHRLIKPQEAARRNYEEWIKFQKYAEKYL